MRIAVFGATGRTGRPLVEQALSEGHEVVALVRDPSKLMVEHPKLTVLQGDVTDRQAVDRAVAGSDVVLSVLGPAKGAPKNVLAIAGENIVAAMKRHGVRRVVALTGAGVAAPGDPPSAGRSIMLGLLKLISPEVLKASESYVRSISESGLDSTVARVPRLRDGERTGAYRTGTLRLGPGQTAARADVADFMLKQLADDTYLHQMPMISS
jgi:nucleoside-diphosphate-sugar epimerase